MTETKGSPDTNSKFPAESQVVDFLQYVFQGESIGRKEESGNISVSRSELKRSFGIKQEIVTAAEATKAKCANSSPARSKSTGHFLATQRSTAAPRRFSVSVSGQMTHIEHHPLSDTTGLVTTGSHSAAPSSVASTISSNSPAIQDALSFYRNFSATYSGRRAKSSLEQSEDRSVSASHTQLRIPRSRSLPSKLSKFSSKFKSQVMGALTNGNDIPLPLSGPSSPLRGNTANKSVQTGTDSLFVSDDEDDDSHDPRMSLYLEAAIRLHSRV